MSLSFISNSRATVWGWVSVIGVFVVANVTVLLLPWAKAPYANTWNSSESHEKDQAFVAQSPLPRILLLGNSRIAFAIRSSDPTEPSSVFNFGISSSGPLAWSLLLSEYLGPTFPADRAVTIFIFPWLDDFDGGSHGAGIKYFWHSRSILDFLAPRFAYGSRSDGTSQIRNLLHEIRFEKNGRLRLFRVAMESEIPLFRYRNDLESVFNGYTQNLLGHAASWLGFKLHFANDHIRPPEGPSRVTQRALQALRKSREAESSPSYSGQEVGTYETAELNVLVGAIRRFLKDHPAANIVVGWLPFASPYVDRYRPQDREWFKSVFARESQLSERLHVMDLQSPKFAGRYGLDGFYDWGEHLDEKGGAKLKEDIGKFEKSLAK